MICERKRNESLMLGRFPFSQPFSTKHRFWTRPGNCGLAQLSVRTEETTTSTAEQTSSEDNFLFIMHGKCVLIMLEWNWEWWLGDNKTTNKETKQPRTFPNFKTWTGYFKSLIEREQRANIRVLYVMKVFSNAKNKALNCYNLFELVANTDL